MFSIHFLFEWGRRVILQFFSGVDLRISLLFSLSLCQSLSFPFFLLQFLFSTTLLSSFIFRTSKKLSASPFYKDFRLKLTNGTKHFVSAERLHSKALKTPAFRNLLGRIIYIHQLQVQNELLDVSLARRRNLNVL